jgi:hypothetical protein
MQTFGVGWLLALPCPVLFLTSCATSQKVQIVQTGDRGLGCGQLAAEMRKLDTSQKEVDAKKGGTGTNKAAAALWLPGVFTTYYDAGQATKRINERRAYLRKLQRQKGC